jgi:molybdopterin converting factor small subunit
VGLFQQPAEPMKLIVNTFGADIKLRREFSLEPASPILRDVLKALREQYTLQLERFITPDLSPAEGSAILVNGRNMLSLDKSETKLADGDELTFTVMVAGG